MGATISQRELRNQNADIFNRVVAGEEFTVTRNGQPVAVIRPIERVRKTVVDREELRSILEHGPSMDYQSFRDDIAAAVDEYL